MPFIDSKITLTVPEDKREVLKSELGKAVSILGKPESFLMVGFEDNYDLYMGGKKLDKGAYVSVSLFGNASGEAYEKMTGKICEMIERCTIYGASFINVCKAARRQLRWRLQHLRNQHCGTWESVRYSHSFLLYQH